MVADQFIAAKTLELCRRAEQLIAMAGRAIQQQTPIHEVENQFWQALREMGRQALEFFVHAQGDGDVGPEHSLPDGTKLARSLQPVERPYLSIFGELTIRRFVYAQRDGQKIQFAAVDARLALPESKFSYVLQDWDQQSAMEQPFTKVSDSLRKILGFTQHVDSLERINRQMAQLVENFHACQQIPPHNEEGQILVETADSKGVPIRRPADAAPIDRHRQRPGPQPDRKRMATVGAVYSVDRHYRTAEDVVDSLFRDPQEQPPPHHTPRPRPHHKRMRASLNHLDAQGNFIDGRAAVFGWISDETASRHAGTYKSIACIIDGEESLWDACATSHPDLPRTDILDLLHVTPRLWEAAALFHPDNSTAAKRFVRERVLRILRGQVKSVIRGLRRMGTQQLQPKAQAKLKVICAYFTKNQDRMQYHKYLACGFPIASGVIEGACRNIVKDRMERTGMNWVISGAQAMLDLRCVYLSDQWEQFIEFRIQRETTRLYPYRDTLTPDPPACAA